MSTRVLVIDDEAPIRLLCRVNLEAEGMDVLEAADGPSGLETARAEIPDVILLDVMMPGLDGWRVAEELLDDERTEKIPIVFLTARAELRDRERGIDLGGVDYVTKPFNPVELAPLGRVLLLRVGRAAEAGAPREVLAGEAPGDVELQHPGPEGSVLEDVRAEHLPAVRACRPLEVVVVAQGGEAVVGAGAIHLAEQRRFTARQTCQSGGGKDEHEGGGDREKAFEHGRKLARIFVANHPQSGDIRPRISANLLSARGLREADRR